jgi:hypothetical protein
MDKVAEQYIELGRLIAIGFEQQLAERGILNKEAASMAAIGRLARMKGSAAIRGGANAIKNDPRLKGIAAAGGISAAGGAAMAPEGKKLRGAAIGGATGVAVGAPVGLAAGYAHRRLSKTGQTEKTAAFRRLAKYAGLDQ